MPTENNVTNMKWNQYKIVRTLRMKQIAQATTTEMQWKTTISWHGLMIYLIFNQLKQFITSNFLVRKIIENNYRPNVRKRCRAVCVVLLEEQKQRKEI